MKIFTTILCFTFVICSFSQEQNPLWSQDYEKQKKWTDSVYNNLSLDERIGQLFMPIVFSKYDESHKNEILKLIENMILLDQNFLFALTMTLKEKLIQNDLD